MLALPVEKSSFFNGTLLVWQLDYQILSHSKKIFWKKWHSHRGAKIMEFFPNKNLLQSPPSNLVQMNSYIKMIHLRHVRCAKFGIVFVYFDS